MSDRQDEDKYKKQFVQQYVDRQRAYLPTYTAEDLFNESHQSHPEHGTTRSDINEFGFDTPVLRPRVRARNDRAQSPHRVQLGALVGPSKSQRVHDTERSRPRASPEEEPSESEALGKEKKRSKLKEPSTPIGGTDDERAARLADRRERKRKKRAIVNPPGRQKEERIVTTTASKKGKANGQKTKKPAALALLYGFSATNVTKERLTLKPTPTLGVFSKGRASAKKKVTTARKPSRNGSFSETAFLNKSSERAADLSNTHDSDDSLDPAKPIPQQTKRKKKDCKCTLKTSQAVTESEIWDIELQSNLPSSVRDVASEPGVANSAPVVVDIRGVEWSASLDLVGKREGRNETRIPDLSISQSPPRRRCVDRSSPPVLDDGCRVQIADAPSIHPSHSASQVGYRVADAQPRPVVPSKFFAVPKPILAQECSTHAPHSPRSNDYSTIPDLRKGTPLYSSPVLAQEVQLDNTRPGTSMCFPEEHKLISVGVALQSPRSNCVSGLEVPDLVSNPVVYLQTTRRVASPINSLTSVLPPMVTSQTPYDMVGLDLTGPSSPYDDCYGRIDTPQEVPGEQDGSYFECSVVESELEQDLERHDPHWSDTLGYWYRSSVGLATYDVDFEGIYDPLAPEFQADEPRAPTYLSEVEDGEWFHMEDSEQDLAGHEDGANESNCYSEGLDEPDENVVDFLEGRALLLGVSVEQEERRRYVRMTALLQAEMDVANRLRDHWRPLRL